jgi:rhodanese-related sulfurtransferase
VRKHRFLTASFFMGLVLLSVLDKTSWSARSTDLPGGLLPGEVISMEEVMKLKEKREYFLLLDARGKRNYEAGHIVGAKLPLTKTYYQQEDLFKDAIIKDPPNTEAALEESMKKYPKGMTIVIYCSDECHASAVLLFKLKKLGFTNVRAMVPGYQSWQRKGYPVTQKLIPESRVVGP